MELKVEVPTTSLFEVVFCQSSIVEYDFGRFKFVRDYRAVISKALSGIRHWHNETYRRKVLQAVGTCELILNLSVPVLQAFSLAILRNCGGVIEDLHYAPDGLRARAMRDMRSLGSYEPRPILSCARESFHVAFGLDPNEQIHLEQELDKWTFTVGTLQYWGGEWSVHDWLPTFSHIEDVPLGQNAEQQQ